MTDMDIDDLKVILARELENALGYDGDQVSRSRRHLQEMYEGFPMGNISDPTRSRVVSRDVLEQVEWVLPQLLRIYVSSNRLWDFQPLREDQENTAEQATEYCNYIFFNDCKGEALLNMALKTALIQRTAFVLVHWVEERTYKYNIYQALTDEQYKSVVGDENVDIVEERSYPLPDPQWTWVGQDAPQSPIDPATGQPRMGGVDPTAGQAAPPMLHDLRTKEWSTNGRVKCELLPPEEVYISRIATDQVLDGKHFVSRKSLHTVSDLREYGFDEDLIQEARGSQGDGGSYNSNTEREARYWYEGGGPMTNGRTDEAMQEILLEESFIRVDFDNDKHAELRHIVSARNGSIIFKNEEIDECPIVSLCAIPMPFRTIGLGVADLSCDIQEIKTFILQQTLDSLSISTTPRLMMNETMMSENTFDDLNNDAAGAVLRYRGDPTAISALNIPFVGQSALPVLSYIDDMQSKRTGVSPTNNGIASDDLNKNTTATGIALKQSAANVRIEYMARTLAPQINVIGERILGLVTRHQQTAREVRITGGFMNFDPRNWHESYDVNCTSAIGTGSKDQLAQSATTLMQVQNEMIKGGGLGKIVEPRNLYNAAVRLTHALGFKDPDEFFLDPDKAAQQPQQPPPPNPDMMKAQVQNQIEQQRSQQQLAIAQQESQFKMQQSEREFQHKMQLENADAQHQVEIERMREQSKQQLEMARLAQSAMKQQQPQVQPQPQMPPGARRAPDGNHYVADPSRPGKYMMVV